MVAGWKRAVERLLVGSGVPRAASRLSRPCTAVLAYHNIVPDGEPPGGDASLHIDRHAFADQLDLIMRHWDVVALEELFAIDGEGEPGPGRVVLTFDDAYHGTMTAGLEELCARELPATVFVPPGMLGGDPFWWDALAPTGASLPPPVRAHALGPLEGRQDRVLQWAAEIGLEIRRPPPHACPADEETLLHSARYERLTLGAHTWSHPNLARLPAEAALGELERSRSWLQARAPRYVDWLAYPYGLRTHETVALAAERFRGAVLVDGGLARRRGRVEGTPHELPRINVPRGLSLDGLALRLSGLLT